MKKWTVLRILTLPAVLSLAFAVGCGVPPTAAEGPAPVELRTYEIPAGYESQVPSMLRSAFGDEGHGRVSVGPAGTVIVVAPAGVQRGVAEFMEQLQQAGPPPEGPKPVLLSYWIVLGLHDPEIADFEVDGLNKLEAIEPALAEIVRSQGPQRFRLLEHVQLTSVGDGWAQAGGRLTQVEQRATVLGEIVLSDIHISLHGQRLQTQVKLRPGQLAVLAQTGVGEGVRSSEFPADNLYYVVTSNIE